MSVIVFINFLVKFYFIFQKECVRRKAATSLRMVRNLSKEEALKTVDDVFEKCYNDKEPFGRTILNNSDYERAYRDRFKYDY